MAISETAAKRVADIKGRYPDPRSAVMAALYIAQEELGYINNDAIEWVAGQLQVSPARVLEVATFYTMYYKRRVGKYHIQLCRTLSCAVTGAKDLKAYLRQRLKVGPGAVTSDGMWSYEEVECLGSCGSGPAVEINDTFFEHLTVERLAALMDRIEREKPDLRFSTIRDALGAGLAGHPKSEVV